MLYDGRLRAFGPVNLALAKLSHEGKIIRFVPEYQCYLLQKALFQGVPREQLADMLAAAEAKLQPSQMEGLKQQARSNEYPGLMPRME